jgi:cytosine/adenosine deaminase-related metal-dependent hydrolase
MNTTQLPLAGYSRIERDEEGQVISQEYVALATTNEVKEIYAKGVELLISHGYTISLGSFFFSAAAPAGVLAAGDVNEAEGFVLVNSFETLPNTYGHPAASYIAKYEAGEWRYQVSISAARCA